MSLRAAMRVVLWTVTLLRIALVPVFLWAAGGAQEIARSGGDAGPARRLALLVLAAMALSDVVDGWIARRFDLATQLGAVVDALADKLVQVSLVAFFALAQGPAYAALPLWLLGLLVGRDVVLGGGLLLAQAWRVPIRVVHRPHGRAGSVLVFAILGWISLDLPRGGLTPLLVSTGLVVVVSGSLYLWEGISQARARLRSMP